MCKLYDVIRLSKKGKRKMHKCFGKECFDNELFTIEKIFANGYFIECINTGIRYQISKDELTCFCLVCHDISYYESSENTEFKIKSVTLNKKEKATTVVFDKFGEKVFYSKTHFYDEYDASVGIALCIAYHLFGSKTQFQKFVKEVEKKQKNDKVKDRSV